MGRRSQWYLSISLTLFRTLERIDLTPAFGDIFFFLQKVICPDSKQVALDPEDLALLVDPAPVQGSSISIINASGQNQAVSSTSTTIPGSVPRSTDRRKVEVSWLRRTEYFNETQNKSRDSLLSPQPLRH